MLLDDPRSWRLWCAVGEGIALLACGVLAIVGVASAAHRHEAVCPPGSYSSPDPTCYVHPHAGSGTAFLLIAVVLAVVVVIGGAVARALPRILDARPVG